MVTGVPEKQNEPGGVGVGVFVAVLVAVFVAVAVEVLVAVLVGVLVAELVGVFVAVDVLVGVLVAVAVFVGVLHAPSELKISENRRIEPVSAFALSETFSTHVPFALTPLNADSGVAGEKFPDSI